VRDGPTIDELVVGDEPASWSAAGFSVDPDGICRIGTVRVRLAGREIGKGLRRWSLRGFDAPAEIDGIPTEVSDRALAEPGVHANGSRLIDHLVWMSPDGDRTAKAFGAATGLDIRRVRDDAETYGLPMRQQFFRTGEVVLELIGPQEPSEGPSRFYGLAITVDDIDAPALTDYAGICGLLLAKGHARTSGASMITGYLGKSDKVDRAMSRFARAYADQTERDHQALVSAVARGILPAS